MPVIIRQNGVGNINVNRNVENMQKKNYIF